MYVYTALDTTRNTAKLLLINIIVNSISGIVLKPYTRY